jgi:NitT/TauT family transport system permease protein
LSDPCRYLDRFDWANAAVLHLARPVAIAIAISLFVTIPVIYSGFKGVEVGQIKLARTFGASRAQIPAKVILPGSVPTMVAALKVDAGFSR